MFGKNSTEDIRAQAPGHNRANDDVCVQEDSHETSRNTSSSVRYPRASAKGMSFFRSASN